jgi:carboxypeptidase C (cathepsin A)
MNALRAVSIVAPLLAALLPSTALATEPSPDAKQCATSEGAPARAVSQKEVDGESGKIRYAATADTFTIALEDVEAKGSIFYVAYTAADGGQSGKRPVTFVVNGGPGAASAYLHLLALGPRIAPLGGDGGIPPPPVEIRDNRQTWLSFTDLVFIDPVGTGYSRSLKPGDDGEKSFWRLNRDLDALVEFIRLYLTCEKRQLSPVFVAGESYGGFRTASLPKPLADDIGLRLNGVILISPVLEFSFLDFDAYQPLSWALILPSYAATALYHGKSSLKRAPGQELAAVLSPVEEAATGAFLTWLARGSDTAAAKGSSTLADVSGFLGLPEEFVLRHYGRISRQAFSKRLLQDSNRFVSLYDGSVTGIDPYPADQSRHLDDPVLDPLTTLLGRTFGAYAEGELGYRAAKIYRVLNHRVSRNWEWMSGRRSQGFQGAADDLKEAMSLNPNLQVLVAHGYYDLVTPYLATSYTIRQMALDDAIRPNLVEKIYEGGHMLYTHDAARAALYKDAQALYRRALAASPARKRD